MYQRNGNALTSENEHEPIKTRRGDVVEIPLMNSYLGVHGIISKN